METSLFVRLTICVYSIQLRQKGNNSIVFGTVECSFKYVAVVNSTYMRDITRKCMIFIGTSNKSTIQRYALLTSHTSDFYSCPCLIKDRSLNFVLIN